MKKWLKTKIEWLKKNVFKTKFKLKVFYNFENFTTEQMKNVMFQFKDGSFFVGENIPVETFDRIKNMADKNTVKNYLVWHIKNNEGKKIENVVKLTQKEYNKLKVKDENTMYVTY